MELISTVTVGAGGASSINFNSIPQTYTDLVLVFHSREYGSDVSFNGVIASGQYVRRYLDGNGATTSTFAGTTDRLNAVFSYYGWGITETISGSMYIPNYTSSTAKTIMSDSVSAYNGTRAMQQIYAGSWSGTDPITSIKLDLGGGVVNFNQHTTASLYGIRSGSGGATVS